MKLIDYEEIETLLNLNAEDRQINELCFNAAYSVFEKQIGHNLAEKNYNEMQTVKDCKIYLDQINITEMVNIIDMNTKERVPNCVIDEKRNIVFLLSSQYENHVLFLNYNAGFTRDSLPADLKEAVIKLFIIKRNDFFNKMNNSETESNGNIPEDIQNIFNTYRRKCL
ncbi:MAG: hypothetical protein ACI4LS_07200 [Treponema sp.]